MDLNHKIIGQGPPLIVLHGLFGMLDNWQSIARQLSEHFTVILIDQRNHGRSPRTESISYPEMAEDLAQFMINNGLHQAHLLGHSMGGKTAMEFAMQHPDLINQLIIVDIAPKEYTGNHQAIFDALLSVDLTNMSSRKQVDAILAKQVKETSLRQFLMKNLTRNKDSGLFTWKMNLPVIHNNYNKILAPVSENFPFDRPTLVLKGEQSRYINDADRLYFEELFPTLQLVEIPKAGHWVHADAPQALLEQIKAFLLQMPQN